MQNIQNLTVSDIVFRLVISALLGCLIGYERRLHHKAIGIAGMVMVAMGSTTYMLVASQVAASDPQALGRTIQGFLGGIGFLGGAVIFKGGTNVRGIKTAAAIWITGAIGLAIAMGLWELGVIVGLAVAILLFIADRFPVPGARQSSDGENQSE